MKAKTCQLGVGTPGRLKQLITEGILPVDSVRLVVLDEADKLLQVARSLPGHFLVTSWSLPGRFLVAARSLPVHVLLTPLVVPHSLA